MDIVVRSKELAFDPTFDTFKDVLCGILDDICQAVRHFDKLETQLYLDWSGPVDLLEVRNSLFRVYML